MKLTTQHVLSRGVFDVLPDRESLAKLMEERTIKLYLGIDPTGSLLTLGHSVVLRKLQQFADLGHEVMLLIGNGTVKIGDPTGRDSTRPELTDKEIEANFKDWQSQASKVLDFNRIKIVRNGDWLDKLTYSDIVKLMAKTTVQQLIERDMFQERLKNNLPIFGHEIIYPLLQGFDSVHLDVDLEIGGSDQTFNMMMGRTLQKAYHNKEKWVLTTPIINGLDGRKMSKSYGNFIAITESHLDMYTKLMRTSDEMIVSYLEVLTDIDDQYISEIADKIKSGHNPMEFKKLMALEITQQFHNAKLAHEAADHFTSLVQEKSLDANVPVVKIKSNQTILQIVSQLMPKLSKKEIKRLISQKAIEALPSNYLFISPEETVALDQVEHLRIGKKNYFKLERA